MSSNRFLQLWKNNKRLQLIVKLGAVWFLFLAMTNYLKGETNALYTTSSTVAVAVQAGEWEIEEEAGDEIAEEEEKEEIVKDEESSEEEVKTEEPNTVKPDEKDAGTEQHQNPDEELDEAVEAKKTVEEETDEKENEEINQEDEKVDEQSSEGEGQ